MYLIIATPLSIYRYNLSGGHLETLMYGTGEYYGISWDGLRIFVSSTNLDSAALKTEADYRAAGKGVVTAFSGTPPSVICSGIAQGHQILVDGEGKLLITNTGFNSIILVDVESRSNRVIVRGDTDCEVIGSEKVGNHFNSLYDCMDSYLIVAHNNGRKSAVYRICKKTYEIINVYDTDAEWAHNVWPSEYGMIICDSRRGRLYDVYSGESIWCAEDRNVLARGLAANNDYIFVGCSKFGNRYTRRYSDGGFWIIDRKTLKTVEKVCLPRTGCVNEIRLFGEHDFCHPVPVMSFESMAALNLAGSFDPLIRLYSTHKYKFINAMESVKTSFQVLKNRRIRNWF